MVHIQINKRMEKLLNVTNDRIERHFNLKPRKIFNKNVDVFTLSQAKTFPIYTIVLRAPKSTLLSLLPHVLRPFLPGLTGTLTDKGLPYISREKHLHSFSNLRPS